MSKADFVVIDDFLDEEDWTAVWTAFQFMDLHPVARAAGAWKLCDGSPLGGEEVVTPRRDEPLVHDPANPQRYPSQTALDHVITAVLSESEAFAEIVGSDWQRLSARGYVYPAGSGLSWHRDDSELYSGAFIYYAHPVWDAHWGGELLLAEGTGQDLSIMGHRFETQSYSEALLEHGMGRFVMPKPNRLVILGGAPHAVAPVSSAAGHNVRASISGFFLLEP